MDQKGLLYTRLLRSIGSRSSLDPPSSDSDDSDFVSGEKSSRSASTKRKKKRQIQSKNVKARRAEKLESYVEPDKQHDESVDLSILLKTNSYDSSYFRLPVELMEKIIKNSVDQHHNPLLQLVTCASVCETWRQIVLNTAGMWNRIFLNYVPSTQNNINRFQTLLKLNPNITRTVKELEFDSWKFDSSACELFTLLTSQQNVRKIRLNNISGRVEFLDKLMKNCVKLTSCAITNSRSLVESRHKWTQEFLLENRSTLETLNLSMNYRHVPPKLVEVICSCQNLKYLDLSCYVYINGGSQGVDAARLAKSLPQLETLRCANVSFKHTSAPEKFHLLNLQQLSIPMLLLDPERDDALYSTLAHGSLELSHIDIRRSYVSEYALCQTPSDNVVSLHLDENENMPRNFKNIITRWAAKLENLSLLRVSNSNLIDDCLKIIAHAQTHEPHLLAIDLTGSEVTLDGLKPLLRSCSSLESVNLTSCRSLPRGFKGSYDSRKSLSRILIRCRT